MGTLFLGVAALNFVSVWQLTRDFNVALKSAGATYIGINVIMMYLF